MSKTRDSRICELFFTLREDGYIISTQRTRLRLLEVSLLAGLLFLISKRKKCHLQESRDHCPSVYMSVLSVYLSIHFIAKQAFRSRHL